MVISGEATADDLRGIKKLEPIIKTRKGFWDNIDKLIQLAEGYEEDDKTASVFGPTGVIAWIGDATSRTMRRWVRLQDVLLRIHPDNQYPPNRERAAKMGLSWVVMTAASLAALVTIGFGDAVLAGDPLAVGGALLALVIGVLSVHLTSLNINDIREGV